MLSLSFHPPILLIQQEQQPGELFPDEEKLAWHGAEDAVPHRRRRRHRLGQVDRLQPDHDPAGQEGGGAASPGCPAVAGLVLPVRGNPNHWFLVKKERKKIRVQHSFVLPFNCLKTLSKYTQLAIVTFIAIPLICFNIRLKLKVS